MDDEFWYEMSLLLTGFQPFTVLVVLYIGLVVGSFLNVVIYRWPLQRSVVFPGSACGGCGCPLKPWHNIPILSYLYQGGVCAMCGAPFSPRYMMIEALVGAGGVFLLYHDQGFGWAWLYHFVLYGIAVGVFFTDLDHWIIPDEINLFGVLFGTGVGVCLPYRQDMDFFQELWGWNVANNLASSILGVAVGWGFFRFIQFLGMLVAKQEAMGDGDVKYAAVLGAFLGWQMALGAFFLSFFLGALVALPLMLAARGKGKEPIPFGTFMSLAAVPVALYGNQILERLAYAEYL